MDWGCATSAGNRTRAPLPLRNFPFCVCGGRDVDRLVQPGTFRPLANTLMRLISATARPTFQSMRAPSKTTGTRGARDCAAAATPLNPSIRCYP